MVESFGGRVTTCLSGVTDFLLVGKEPGAVKVRMRYLHPFPPLPSTSPSPSPLHHFPRSHHAPACESPHLIETHFYSPPTRLARRATAASV